MKKFYEYNNQQVNEGKFSDETTENVHPTGSNSEETGIFGVTNYTPVIVTGAAAGGVYLTYKTVKGILSFVRGMISVGKIGRTIRNTVDNKAFSASEEAYNKRLNGAYNVYKKKIITADGVKKAKQISTWFKYNGLEGIKNRKVRRAVVKAVMDCGNDFEAAAKKVKAFYKEGKISKYTADTFEDFVTDPKQSNQVKKLMVKINSKRVANAGMARRSVNGAVNIIKNAKLTKNVVNSSVWKSFGKVVAKYGGKTIAKFIPFVGWASLIWDVVDITLWLAGDASLYEPEEGWRDAKHSSTKNADAKKTYEIIGSSIINTINLIGGPANNLINGGLGGDLILRHDTSIIEKDPELYSTFITDLDILMSNSELVQGFEDLIESQSSIVSDVKDSYNGINVSGMKDDDDWDVIKEAGNYYELDSDTNVYGVKVAEDIGTFTEYFSIPGMNAMGWASVFTSEDYLESVAKEYSIDGRDIIELLYYSYKATNLYGSNFESFDYDSFRRIFIYVLGKNGKEFYSKYKMILSTFKVGIVKDGVWAEFGDMNDYINQIKNVVSKSINEMKGKSSSSTMALTNPILSVGVVFAVIQMIINILQSNIYFLNNLENSQLSFDIKQKVSEEVVRIGDESSDKENEELIKKAEKTKVDTSSSMKDTPTVDQKEEERKGGLEKISGYDDYL